MSRTNENKLKMKDIATIGIFSALLFVVTMVAGALMGISMVLNMYSVAVVAVLSAPLYMLIMAKVHKKGAVLLTFAIVGILWGLFGGIFVLIWMLGFGVVGEVLASKSKYQNYKMLTVSFGLYSVGYYLGAIAPLYYYPVFWYGFDRPKETVDTAYFEENGGYDFARDFFEEALGDSIQDSHLMDDLHRGAVVLLEYLYNAFALGQGGLGIGIQIGAELGKALQLTVLAVNQLKGTGN